VGFAKSVRQEQDRWLVTTTGRELPLRIEADARTGVVDYFVSTAPGVEVVAGSRVIPNGLGSGCVFTQFQAPEMARSAFQQSIRALEHELRAVGALLGGGCPLGRAATA